MTDVQNTTSWGSRLKNAFVGLLLGVILILGSIYIIFWNESSELHTKKSLQQTENVLISVPDDPIDPNNNLAVIYFSGIAKTKEILSDHELGVDANAIRLSRHVEMYQWQENKKNESRNANLGSETTTTTYSYQKVWSPYLLNSDRYHDQSAHKNPNKIPLSSTTLQALKVSVGDFYLPSELINKISGDVGIDLTNVNVTPLQAKLKRPITHVGDALYVGNNPNLPQIGDLRITMTEVLPQTVSVIAQQTGATLQPYTAPSGRAIALLTMGKQTPQEMIRHTQFENQIQSWIIRVGTLISMIIGFLLILQPIVVFADIVPFFGTLAEFGTGLVAILCGLALWTVSTAFAWIAVRPLMAMILIIVVILVIGIIYLTKKPRPEIER